MYPIVQVEAESSQAVEQMGSKPKFWFLHASEGWCLFKAARQGSGEDWAEKVAEQIAACLGIPHARYDLARSGEDRGVITPRLTSEEEHLPQAGDDAVGLMAGYLMLDAVIGNTDRHHENWALVEAAIGDDTRYSMAPTFDHASSLGRNEPLARVQERLSTRDRNFTVEAYARRARAALFHGPEDHHPLTPVEAFQEVAKSVPEAARAWCGTLPRLTEPALRAIMSQVPSDRMPAPVQEFVVRMIQFNGLHLGTVCRSL